MRKEYDFSKGVHGKFYRPEVELNLPIYPVKNYLLGGLKMSIAVENLLNAFERLAEFEKRELAFEIIRRAAHFDFPPLTDEELVLNAEAIFLELDRLSSSQTVPYELLIG
jgi:hypothetical protein